MEDIELNGRTNSSDKITSGLSKINLGKLKKDLNSRITKSNEKNLNPEYSPSVISFDITILNGDDIFSDIEDKIVESKNRKLLSHPIIEAFLLAKWNSIKFWYYLNTLAYFIFVINLTLLLYLIKFDIAGN